MDNPGFLPFAGYRARLFSLCGLSGPVILLLRVLIGPGYPPSAGVDRARYYSRGCYRARYYSRGCYRARLLLLLLVWYRARLLLLLLVYPGGGILVVVPWPVYTWYYTTLGTPVFPPSCRAAVHGPPCPNRNPRLPARCQNEELVTDLLPREARIAGGEPFFKAGKPSGQRNPELFLWGTGKSSSGLRE